MPTISKADLSGATDGMPIKVVATATLGTTIHTGVTGTTDFDEVWIYATNSDTVARMLTIEYGGATDPDNLIEQEIPLTPGGLVLVIPGLLIHNAKVITAFAAAANVITLTGFVNQIRA